jgi:hypothetical protein
VRRVFSRIVTVGVAASIGVTVLPQVAMAAGVSNSCSIRVCNVTARNFPGGTISVDADSGGTADTGYWAISDSNSPIQCEARFRTEGGVRSWTCSGVARGTVTMTLTGPAPLRMGLRW